MKHTYLKRTLIWGCVMVVSVATIMLYACAPQSNDSSSGGSSSSSTEVQKDSKGLLQKSEAAAPTSVPQADKFGVIGADSWADQYPNEYNSYLESIKNVPEAYAEDIKENPDTYTNQNALALLNGDYSDDKANYLETNPEIKTLGLGYGYAKYYTEPGSHLYSLYTATFNGRINEKSKIACYACKTPQYNYDAEQYGEGFYLQPHSVGAENYTESISCANCHNNENPTEMQLHRTNWIEIMEGDDTPMESQVCGQCHCDYSMHGETSEPTSPYAVGGGTDAMTPDQALKFYNDNNFVDWTYESTGAQMISVRHAEFEYVYGGEGNTMTTKYGFTCSDCHMPATQADDGTVYTSHTWQSPLENAQLLETCNSCHQDLVSQVKDWQEKLDGRTKAVGERAEDFVQNFEKAIADKKVSDDDKTRLQTIQREACYYWNFVAAENSEGAHNPDLTWETLDKADELLDEADKILGTDTSYDTSQYKVA